jgi:hypothetical protein
MKISEPVPAVDEPLQSLELCSSRFMFAYDASMISRGMNFLLPPQRTKSGLSIDVMQAEPEDDDHDELSINRLVSILDEVLMITDGLDD